MDQDQESDLPRPSKEAEAYIAKIKNDDKKLYARLYYKFLLGETYKPDYSKISYMAAQGVHLHLCKLLGI